MFTDTFLTLAEVGTPRYQARNFSSGSSMKALARAHLSYHNFCPIVWGKTRGADSSATIYGGMLESDLPDCLVRV